MDWNRFEFRFELSRPFTEMLISIDGYRRAVERILIPNSWKTELNRLNRVRAIHGTTAIEGNRMSEEAVRALLESSGSNRDTDVSYSPDQLQVQNAGRAQDWIRERIQSSSGIALRLEDLLHLHKLVTGDEKFSYNEPGKLRRHAVVVGSEELGGVHQCAPYVCIERLLRGFFEWLYSRESQEKLHPVVRALAAHFFLVTIHPFGDGNGRVSRLVEAYLLLVGGYNTHGFYGLSNFFYQNSDNYKILLQRSRTSQPFDLTEFISFGLTGFESELKGINTFIQQRQNRMMYMDTINRSRSTRRSQRRYVLSSREWNFLAQLVERTNPHDPFAIDSEKEVSLSDVLFDPTFRIIYEGVSTRTLVRDIQQLQEKGFVRMARNSNNELVFSIDLNAIERY